MQTAVEKILSKNIGKPVKSGEYIMANIDFAMINDATMIMTMKMFDERKTRQEIKDPDKTILIYDHFFPAASVDIADSVKKMREFSKNHNILFSENEGVCHQIMLEKYVLPYQVIVGADSHTCSYGAIGCISTGIGSTDMDSVITTRKMWMKVPETIRININGKFKKGVYAKDLILKIIGDVTASGFTYACIEFAGNTLIDMEISDRITLCNMVIEAGAKCSYITPDNKVEKFIQKRIPNFKLSEIIESDKDYKYKSILEYKAENIEPMVACPHTVDNVFPLKTISGTKINQVFIGSCTNGRLEDLRIVADIVKGKKIANFTRMIVVPASTQVMKEAIKEGIINTLLDFGATINHPSCSNCWGACQGLLGSGEKQVSTANRNFKGRNGSNESETYLVSPASAAYTAIYGMIR